MGLFLYHGDEGYLVERAFNAKWSEVTADLESELDAEMLDAESSPADVFAATSSVGFFSAGRVVGVREWKSLAPHPGRKSRSANAAASDPASQCAEALEQVPAAAHLVLSAGAWLTPTNPVLKVVQARGEARGYQR